MAKIIFASTSQNVSFTIASSHCIITGLMSSETLVSRLFPSGVMRPPCSITRNPWISPHMYTGAVSNLPYETILEQLYPLQEYYATCMIFLMLLAPLNYFLRSQIIVFLAISNGLNIRMYVDMF